MQAAANTLRLPRAVLSFLGLSTKGASSLDPAAVPCILQHTGLPLLLHLLIPYNAVPCVHDTVSDLGER